VRLASGSVLHKQIQEVLTNVKFDTDWLVGQNECYDAAGNMRGEYSGLATHFQKTCKKAVNVWCNAHRLNLVMNSVATYCQDVKHTVGLYWRMYVLYNILCCLPVSSASAERVTSKFTIIKNRLRTSLADETMSALMILVAERDKLEINIDDVISRMASVTEKSTIVLTTLSSWLLIPNPEHSEHCRCRCDVEPNWRDK